MRKVTEDFIGTCQACFGEFKVSEKSKQIVYHGYQRPGIGYTLGGCAGTDHAPFEYDTALTVQIITLHRETAAKAATRCKRLETGVITKLTRYWTEYDRQTSKSVEKSEEVSPGHEHWKRTLELAIARCESDVTYHHRVADYLLQMVDAWKPGKIIGIDLPTTGKERALRKAYDPADADAAEKRAAEKAKRDAKPGKLKVMFYVAEGWPSNDDDQATRRAFFDKRDVEREQRVARIKTWAKATFSGKPLMIREASEYDLPNAIRKNIKDAHVVAVHIPWDYRDQIATLLPSADRYEVESKKRSFTMVGEPDA